MRLSGKQRGDWSWSSWPHALESALIGAAVHSAFQIWREGLSWGLILGALAIIAVRLAITAVVRYYNDY